MTRLAALGLLLLAGCEQIEAAEDSAAWAEDQASANADAIAALEDRIEALESENERLRDDLTGVTEAATSDLTRINDEVHRLGNNDEAYHAQIDYLRARLGQGPMPTK